MKDVRVRESTIAINSAMRSILPFPCMFQIVADKLVAFDQAMMQPYQVIILPLRCSESFSNASFLEFLARTDRDIAPAEVIYLVAAEDEGDGDESKMLLRLTADSSIPVHDLAQLLSSIVNTTILPVAQVSAQAHSVETEDVQYYQEDSSHAAIPVRHPSTGASASNPQRPKRRLTVAEAVPVQAPVSAPSAPQRRASAHSQMLPHAGAAHTPAVAAAYQQYWLSAQAHHHWLLQQQQAQGQPQHAQQLGYAAPAPSRVPRERRHAATQPPAENEDPSWPHPAVAPHQNHSAGTESHGHGIHDAATHDAYMYLEGLGPDEDDVLSGYLDTFDDADELFTPHPARRG
jgi:hypothetical protein